MTSTEKLVKALEDAHAPVYLIDRAKRNLYHDFKSLSGTPIIDLVNDLTEAGLTQLADRARDGEFDAGKEEAEEWAASEEGKRTIKKLGKPQEN